MSFTNDYHVQRIIIGQNALITGIKTMKANLFGNWFVALYSIGKAPKNIFLFDMQYSVELQQVAWKNFFTSVLTDLFGVIIKVRSNLNKLIIA